MPLVLMTAAALDALSRVSIRLSAPAVSLRLEALVRELGGGVSDAGATVAIVEVAEESLARDLDALDALLLEDPLRPVVVLTPDPAGSASERAALRRGAFAVLRQPVRAADVVRVLDEIRAEDGCLVRLV